MAKYVLNTIERMNLLSVFPQEGDFSTQRLVSRVRDNVGFSEEELIILKALEAKGKLIKIDSVPEKEVQVGKIVDAIIVDALVKLDKDKKLTAGHVPLYEKFVEPDEEVDDEEDLASPEEG